MVMRMAVRPGIITFRCNSCGWSKTTHPKSDVLRDGIDVFMTCPKCGSSDVSSESTANPITRDTTKSWWKFW